SNLAETLQLSPSLQTNAALQAQYFSGNQLPEGAESIALAYSGHQFGQLSPQLGDGRAHLIGEVLDKHDHRFDIQLKGSGSTPFSRRGDGRCALGPAMREYIMSEAMHFLAVPTSRCLAVVTTGEPVYRETLRPGAVVTRVAASHIRVGTFQYFAIRNDIESLTTLLDYAINRHYPEINIAPENKALQFLEAVIAKQITLVVEWMRVGFIHGVMNTDNVAISGETIDFGPCAMMGIYDPNTVYSSIDTQGRYAFGNQPSITLWNMTRLAECLIPLIGNDEKAAIAIVEPLLMQFSQQFEQAYFKMLANKLGLAEIEPSDRVFIAELLETMKNKQWDYTQMFTDLTQSLDDENLANELKQTLGDWYDTWRLHVGHSQQEIEIAKAIMKTHNPVVIPRNHHVESVLKACEETGSTQAADDFLTVLRSPYNELANTGNYQDLPVDDDRDYHTFCGT
ncbi:MAG TPA: YdiU family protein, partial [Methylococcaceae bacterium]|nr:YdiU family protein [Methylococcaceae bacterium]